jgi:hypothetical protein
MWRTLASAEASNKGAWETLWPQVNRVVEGPQDGLGDALGDQLVGLYLSGSLALGGFHGTPAA